MRKNTSTVLGKFIAGKSFRFSGKPSIWTDGDRIMSYNTCIVDRVTDDCVIVNMTKYSRTTTIHQNALHAWFVNEGYRVVTVDQLHFGVQHLDYYVDLD